MRGAPICARMDSPRARSATWIARAATGKLDGISPALIPSRKRRSSSAAPPVAAFCKKRSTSASLTSGATQIRGSPGADPFSVALSTLYLRKPAIESRRLCGARSAFAASAPFLSAYALRTRRHRPLVPEDGRGPVVPHPSLRRGRQSSLRHSPSTKTPGSPFPAPPSRRACAVVLAASRYL